MNTHSILPNKHRWGVTAAIVALPFFLSISGGAMALETSEEDYALKLLGKYLFFDKISSPSRQSCSSCHTPDVGWTNGTSGINLNQVAVTGANPHTRGNLKPPANAYASFIPNFDPAAGPEGGAFWNGRASGEEVAGILFPSGDGTGYEQYAGPVADQAHASPFINPVEQGLPSKVATCEIVKSAKYAPLFKEAYGENEMIDCTTTELSPQRLFGDPAIPLRKVDITFARFALALAAYQHSKEVNPFDSRRDTLLPLDENGRFPLDGFTDQENRGHFLFYVGNGDSLENPRGAGCTQCHRNGNRGGTTPDERYTNDQYRNIGIPHNPEIPGGAMDIGLAATTMDSNDEGLHKVPTMRNVDKRRGDGFKKAYGHNGWFKSLESLVHFYNTSDTTGTTAASFGVTTCPPGVETEKDALALNCWPEPEFDNRIDRALIGNLFMTAEDEAALVSYLKTLTDTSTAKAPKPFNQRTFDRGQPF